MLGKITFFNISKKKVLHGYQVGFASCFLHINCKKSLHEQNQRVWSCSGLMKKIQICSEKKKKLNWLTVGRVIIPVQTVLAPPSLKKFSFFFREELIDSWKGYNPCPDCLGATITQEIHFFSWRKTILCVPLTRLFSLAPRIFEIQSCHCSLLWIRFTFNNLIELRSRVHLIRAGEFWFIHSQNLIKNPGIN